MQLETYISDLLYRYDCVTVPHFGAFLTQKISAKLDREHHVFFPPQKTIAFNAQLKHNDGLLASYISGVEQISYEAAVEAIAKQVKAYDTFLQEGETLQFEGIGSLHLNPDAKLVFKPLKENDFLIEAFGLSAFEVQNIDRSPAAIPMEIAEPAPVEASAPVATLHPETRRNNPYLKYAAVGLIALTLGGLGLSSYHSRQVESHNQLAQEKANQEIDLKVQEATFVIQSPLPAVYLNVEKQEGRYHLIAGAFRVEENAQSKVEELRADGFKARTIGVNRYGLFEVVYSSYENSNDALVALKDIRQNHNKEAWLLVKDLD